MATTYSLRSVKVVRALSEETTCFTAAIFADGRKVGTVANRGTGGCHEYNILAAADSDAFSTAAIEWAKQEGGEVREYGMSGTADAFVDFMLDEIDNQKAAAKNAKKGFPLTGLVHVGEGWNRKVYTVGGKSREAVEHHAAKLGGTVRRWYGEGA